MANNCPINLQPMADWIKSKGATCKPCAIGMTISWYLDHLNNIGKQSMAKELNSMVTESGTPEQVCNKMDNIKHSLSNSDSSKLFEFDCLTQQLD